MRALDTIHRNATAQVQIVNDLLDVSRIVRGNVQLSPRLMSLGPLLTLSVESITPTAEAKGVDHRQPRSARRRRSCGPTTIACSRCSGTCSRTR